MLSIQRHGTISLNRPALELLGTSKFVVFMYDRENATIGLRGTDSEADGYPVRPALAKGVSPEDATTFVISGRAFLKFYDITPASSCRFQPYLNDDGVLCVALDATSDSTEVVAGPQADVDA